MDADEGSVREQLRHLFANTAGVAGLIALVVAAIAYRHAPAVADLYNYVYPPHGRAHRAESPKLFLFGFPAMLLAGSLISRFAETRRRTPLPFPVLVPFLLIWLSIFFFGSLSRSWAVLHLHG